MAHLPNDGHMHTNAEGALVGLDRNVARGDGSHGSCGALLGRGSGALGRRLGRSRLGGALSRGSGSLGRSRLGRGRLGRSRLGGALGSWLRRHG